MVKQQMNLVEIEAMNSLQELTLEELDNVLGAVGGVIQIHFIQTKQW
ncbi:type A2 lanthipeptide [Streptococcus sp. HMSC076C09]|nr:type A2 lanthipeptide [Streptococcus sp. HMSC076C09]OHQ87360.1 lacticin family bacteriocin [Streptococcus sp. HMSC076C09]